MLSLRMKLFKLMALYKCSSIIIIKIRVVQCNYFSLVLFVPVVTLHSTSILMLP